MACPDCGTPAVVPASSQRRQQAPAASSSAPPPESLDIYNVLEGRDQPPPTATEVYRRHIPVVCMLCHTRLHATEDQVGQVMVCPDCGTANVVPPAPEDLSPAEPPEVVEGYQLAAGSQPAPKGAADRRELTFRCPLCHTRLQAAPDQAGRTMTCPDCSTEFPIPNPASEDPQWNPFEGGIEVYAIAGGQAETAAASAAPALARAEPRSLAEAHPLFSNRDLLPPRRLERKLPPWPLVNGVFAFPFYRHSLVCWGKLAVGAMVVLGLLSLAITWSQGLDSAQFGLGAALLGSRVAYLAGLVAILGALYSIWVSSSVLRILSETANGVDRIEEWANQDFVEWAFEALYLVNSFVLSVLVGWGVESLAARLPAGCGMAVSVFVLFPILLLSMLETGTVMNPVSPAVLGSLASRWWVWGGFYLLAGLLAAGVAAAGVGFWALAGAWSAIPSAIVVTPAIMIYFRLLGRLGWYITDRSRRSARRAR
jgi:DNA-directed RNA polymerase subunit RPC12/RpoP